MGFFIFMNQTQVLNEQRNKQLENIVAPYLTPKKDAVIQLHYGKHLLYFASYQLLQKFAHDLLSIDLKENYAKLDIWYVINCDELKLNLITSDVITVFDFLTIKEDSRIYGNEDVFLELLEFSKREDALNYINLL